MNVGSASGPGMFGVNPAFIDSSHRSTCRCRKMLRASGYNWWNRSPRWMPPARNFSATVEASRRRIRVHVLISRQVLLVTAAVPVPQHRDLGIDIGFGVAEHAVHGVERLADQGGAATPDGVDQDEIAGAGGKAVGQPVHGVIGHRDHPLGMLILRKVVERRLQQVHPGRRLDEERLPVLVIQAVQADVGIFEHDLGRHRFALAQDEVLWDRREEFHRRDLVDDVQNARAHTRSHGMSVTRTPISPGRPSLGRNLPLGPIRWKCSVRRLCVCRTASMCGPADGTPLVDPMCPSRARRGRRSWAVLDPTHRPSLATCSAELRTPSARASLTRPPRRDGGMMSCELIDGVGYRHARSLPACRAVRLGTPRRR